MSRSLVQTLPNLVIAGVTKAGTSSLHRYLGQHPDIGVASQKELDYYAPVVRGEQPAPLSEYAAHFRHCADVAWRLDASPRYYIGGPRLVRQLADDLAGARVIIVIREPVARMWSGYTFKRSRGRLEQRTDFDAFVEECVKVTPQNLYEKPELYRTLATGVYVNFLPAWFDVFGDNLRVVFFDDLVASPAGLTSELCEWLGLSTGAVERIDFAARNATVEPRSQMLRRAAVAINNSFGRVLGDESTLRRRMRSSYQRVNDGQLDQQMTQAQRARLHEIYEPTLPPLRDLLQARGYERLPGWLS